LEVISAIDTLTNIGNRNRYNEAIEIYLNLFKKYNKKIAYILLDIDFFKSINDNFGHDKGDDVLIKSTKVILTNIKKDDLFCRVGGEEFVIITHIEKDKVLNYANSIKDDIENLKIEHSGNKASKYVTISLGVVCKNAIEINSSEELYKEADDNLYEAKRSGRNCVVIK